MPAANGSEVFWSAGEVEADAQGRRFGVQRLNGAEAGVRNQTVWYPLSRRGEGKVPELGGLVPPLVAQLVSLVPMPCKTPGQFLQSAEHGESNLPFWEPGLDSYFILPRLRRHFPKNFHSW